MMENSKQLDTEKQSSDNLPYHNDAKLLSICSWANTVSWIALVGYVLAFLGRLAAVFQDSSQENFTVVSSPSFFPFTIGQYNFWINSLLLVITGITFFLVLQAVSQGILMLMDLEENGYRSTEDFRTPQK